MHLTDAGGWRIEMDKYPKLTSETWPSARNPIGGSGGTDRDRKYLPEGTPGAYGGYFTKEDIREIVDYAAASGHINIIPEIEFPGHSDEVLDGVPGAELCRQSLTTNGRFLHRQRAVVYVHGGRIGGGDRVCSRPNISMSVATRPGRPPGRPARNVQALMRRNEE